MKVIDAVERFNQEREHSDIMREFRANHEKVCKQLGVDTMEEAINLINELDEKGLITDELIAAIEFTNND